MAAILAIRHETYAKLGCKVYSGLRSGAINPPVTMKLPARNSVIYPGGMKNSLTGFTWAPLLAFALTMFVGSPLRAQDPKIGAYKGTITIQHLAASVGSGTLTTKSTSKVDAEAVIPTGMTRPVIHILGVPDPGRIGASARKYCRIDFNQMPHSLFYFGGDKASALTTQGTEKIKGNSVFWESTFSQTAGEFDEFTFQTTVTIKLVRAP